MRGGGWQLTEVQGGLKCNENHAIIMTDRMVGLQ